MERGELLEAIDELQGRLDVVKEGGITDEDYHRLTDNLEELAIMLAKREL